MMGYKTISRILLLICLSFLVGTAQQQLDHAKYIPKTEYPVLDELEKEREARQAVRDSITEAIRERQETQREQEEAEEQQFVADFSNVVKPGSPDDFKTLFHFAPVAQYQSGMCWCFCTTSFLESEVYRLTGQKIKLSELHTVYYEYIEKARRYIRERGDSYFSQGSETNAVYRIIKKYGAVPAEAYTGLIEGRTRHDHTELFDELETYLDYCNQNDLWDEASALETVKIILNKHIGKPPESFQYDGLTYTPREFVEKILKLEIDDYYEFMSTSSIPFYTKGEFEVPDNWCHAENYYNLPLDEWYALIKKSIDKGYTMPIGGDVSEPGYYGKEDAAFVPTFDIPREFINQDAREYRIDNESTQDDHGVHIVGYTRIGDHDWYLIKDSARGARQGEFEGYYFYRDDYIRLKMLTFSVHRDVVKRVLRKF